MYEKCNQAYTMHPDFFDPLHQYATVEMEPGNPKFANVTYIHEKQSVTVNEDGSVTFYMYAPSAKTVAVSGLGGYFSNQKVYLESDGEGGFSGTISSLHAAMHYYSWYVDDVLICNPKAGVNYGCFRTINTFEVPECQDDFFEIKDVPHGEIHICKYLSNVSGHLKECYVYTPAGYQKTEKKYPVLYLQHGVGENETGWIWQGKANFILDNLIADKKCQEMIVVMCSGYAFKPQEDPVFFPGDFDCELVNDVIPFVEHQFRVIRNRSARAVAGLSLGSAQATLTACKHQELFSALGVFSGVGLHVFEEHEKNCKDAMLIFLSCGEMEKEICEQQKKLQPMLQQRGDSCVQKAYEGYHEWFVWRKSLRDFAQLLFQQINENIEDIQSEKMTYSSQVYLEQTRNEQMLFFDPVYRQIAFAIDENGNPAGKYPMSPKGFRMIDKNTVEVSIYAPQAKTVEADIFNCGKLQLQPSATHAGYWTGIRSNLQGGFHYVIFEINGVRVVNYDAPVGYGCFQTINYLEVEEEQFDLHMLRDIPHGHVQMSYYTSSQTGRMKLCYVYTPPGYEMEQETRYPVLYLQHGGGENEIGWFRQGKIANMADYLISQGRMKKMIIVMNTGYAFKEDGTSHGSLGSFPDELVMDCIAHVDDTYRTIADREHRAMAGLSMGGMQTQRIVMTYPEKFAWAGIFSGGLTLQNNEVDYTEVLFDAEEMKKRFELFFVACGMEDAFYMETRKNVEIVLEKGVAMETFFEHGWHDWTFWRHCAAEFLQKVFQ